MYREEKYLKSILVYQQYYPYSSTDCDIVEYAYYTPGVGIIW